MTAHSREAVEAYPDLGYGKMSYHEYQRTAFDAGRAPLLAERDGARDEYADLMERHKTVLNNSTTDEVLAARAERDELAAIIAEARELLKEGFWHRIDDVVVVLNRATPGVADRFRAEGWTRAAMSFADPDDWGVNPFVPVEGENNGE